MCYRVPQATAHVIKCGLSAPIHAERGVVEGRRPEVFNAIAGSCTVTRSHIPIYFSPTTRGSGFISKVYEIWPGVGFFLFWVFLCGVLLAARFRLYCIRRLADVK